MNVLLKQARAQAMASAMIIALCVHFTVCIDAHAETVDWISGGNGAPVIGSLSQGTTVTWTATGNATTETPNFVSDSLPTRYQGAGGLVTITFSNPVINPTLTVVNLQPQDTVATAAPLDIFIFSDPVTKLTGSSNWSIYNGNRYRQISGDVTGNEVIDGSVQLPGQFTQISFTRVNAPFSDGTWWQLNVDSIAELPTVPAPLAIFAVPALLLLFNQNKHPFQE